MIEKIIFILFIICPIGFQTHITDILFYSQQFSVFHFVFQVYLYFSRNSSVSKIAKELMIENENLSSPYEHFYETRAPIYCSYSKKVHKENFIGVIIKLISTIGAIVRGLSIISISSCYS